MVFKFEVTTYQPFGYMVLKFEVTTYQPFVSECVMTTYALCAVQRRRRTKRSQQHYKFAHVLLQVGSWCTCVPDSDTVTRLGSSLAGPLRLSTVHSDAECPDVPHWQLLHTRNLHGSSSVWRTCFRRSRCSPSGCSAIQNHNGRRPCGKIIA